MNDLLGQVQDGAPALANEVQDLKLQQGTAKPTPPKPVAKPTTVGQENSDANVEKKKKWKIFKRGKKHEDGGKSAASPATPATPTTPTSAAADPEPEEEEEEPEEPALTQQFMTEVSRVKDLLTTIHSKRNEVEQLHERVQSMTKTAEIQAAQSKIDKDLTLIKRYANDAKASVEKMKKDAFPDEGDAFTGADRMRNTIVSGLMTRLKRELDGFRAFEEHVRTEYRDVVERRLRVVTGQEVDENTVEQMIDSGEAENVFKKAMMSNSAAVVDVLNQTEERYKGMQKLTEDLINLHQMMLDFSVLVAEQGAMIDSIEAQVAQAADFISDGTSNVISAKGHKKTKEKYKSAAIGTAGAAAGATAAAGALKIAGTAGALAL